MLASGPLKCRRDSIERLSQEFRPHKMVKERSVNNFRETFEDNLNGMPDDKLLKNSLRPRTALGSVRNNVDGHPPSF